MIGALDGLSDLLKKDEKPAAGGGYFDVEQNAVRVQKYKDRVDRINAMEDEIELLEDEALAAKTQEFRSRLAAGATEDELLEEVFAVVREAAWRAIELRHYDVQLVGAMALHDGYLAEMGTGEGKSLTCTCAVYLNALTGKGAHLVTVNDYLARRDAEAMGQVYRFLGLSVGLIQADMKPPQRREAYACDVTYVTNQELGFDFLRDNLAMTAEEVVLRDLNFCVVDEGDSVLIDEARVPLVISSKTQASAADRYSKASKLAAALQPNVHYEVFEKQKTITLNDQGVRDSETALNVNDLYNPSNPWAAYVINAIKARALFEKDKEYVVKGDEVLIVDEFSGRILEGRRWGDGLHQAIEAKEAVPVQPETEVAASITYQSLFRRYGKLSAMSGTALTEAEELATFYNLRLLQVPPVLPVQRVDYPDAVYKTVKGKSLAALDELLSMHRAGRPVLVGTTSIEASAVFSSKLTELGIKHEVLNAKAESAQREAEIISQAGREKSVTISTNMAGRGTDILLGGSPAVMARLRVREVLAQASATEVPQVAAGYYPCALSAEAVQLAQAAAAALTAELSGQQRGPGCMQPAEGGGFSLESLDELLAVAASSADVYEGSATDLAREAIEQAQEEFEAVLAPEKERVLALGGLHVIGTNLHDSRRIDLQLRGRAGRQGDPGSSHFFLSLDDRIFRLFGADRVKSLLDFLRVPEDTALESGQVARVVAETQEGVERYYYELRKKLSDFDAVLAFQRDQTYTRRAELLRADADAMHGVLQQAVRGTATAIVSANWKQGGGAEGAAVLAGKLRQFFPSIALDEASLQGSKEEAEAAALAAAEAALAAHEQKLEAAKGGLSLEAARYVSLLQVDTLWKQHMKALSYVKDFAGLKAYADKDPLEVYRTEGLALFDSMQKAFEQNTAFSFTQYDPKAAQK